NVQDFRAAFDNLLVQQKEGYANSTNRDSTVSPSISVVGEIFTNADDLPTDSLMPDLEDTVNLLNTGIFSGAYDDEDMGAKADLNNLETTMNVSPIPTTRIYKDHPKDQIIGDINSATQTRRMTRISKELAMAKHIEYMVLNASPLKISSDSGFSQFYSYYALTENPTIYVSLIHQFWQTAYVSISENGEMEINATIDGRVKIVTEASIRRHLKLEDSDGISTLTNTEIFEQLALMGVDIPLFPTMLVQGLIFQEGSTVIVVSHHTPTSAPSTSQPPTLPPSMQTTHVAEEAATMPHDSPLLRVHSLGSDEGSTS
ncbi:hypothetical protein Tco_0694494, partial [Tanacetum coccineum]